MSEEQEIKIEVIQCRTHKWEYVASERKKYCSVCQVQARMTAVELIIMDDTLFEREVAGGFTRLERKAE